MEGQFYFALVSIVILGVGVMILVGNFYSACRSLSSLAGAAHSQATTLGRLSGEIQKIREAQAKGTRRREQAEIIRRSDELLRQIHGMEMQWSTLLAGNQSRLLAIDITVAYCQLSFWSLLAERLRVEALIPLGVTFYSLALAWARATGAKFNDGIKPADELAKIVLAHKAVLLGDCMI